MALVGGKIQIRTIYHLLTSFLFRNYKSTYFKSGLAIYCSEVITIYISINETFSNFLPFGVK